MGQNSLRYFPAKAFPKLSSSRLLERTMIGACPNQRLREVGVVSQPVHLPHHVVAQAQALQHGVELIDAGAHAVLGHVVALRPSDVAALAAPAM